MNRGALSGVTPRKFDEREFFQTDTRYADKTLPPYVSQGSLLYPSSWDPGTQTYNCTPDRFPNFRLNLAKARAGVSNCYVYSDGDSVTSGAQLGVAAETYSYTAVARILMANSGRWGTITEPGPITLDNISPPIDSRVSTSGSLVTGVGLGNWGVTAGAGWGGNGTWSITFGPVVCDTFEVYDKIQGFPTGSGWNWSIDGGATTYQAQTNSGGDAQGNRKVTISAGSVGSHTLTISSVGGGLYGVITGITYKTAAATPHVVWAKRGVGGSSAGDTSGTILMWNNPLSTDLCYTGDGTHTHPNPHLVILQLGTNPEQTGDSPASWFRNMGALITTIKSAGADVLLCVAPPGGAGVSSAQAKTLAAIAPLCYQLADTYNVGLYDMFWRWGGSYTSSMDQYFQIAGNSGHPSQAGHADMGNGIYNALCRVA